MPSTWSKYGDWKRLERAIDPARFSATATRHLKIAAGMVGKVVLAKVRSMIEAGAFTPNAALTMALKKPDKPLIETGHGLFQALTSEVVSDMPTKVFVGVKKSEGIYNIAVAIHEGVSIPVTGKMIALFDILWRVSEGKLDSTYLTGRAKELYEKSSAAFKPISLSKAAIIIPRRPFIKAAIEDPTLRADVRKVWEWGLRNAFREMAKG